MQNLKRTGRIAVVVLLVITGVLIAGYVMIERFIFYPGKLPGDFPYALSENDRELFIKTKDGETVNGILFKANLQRGVILYFHGNAGSLSSWQYVAQDILPTGFDLLVIDYRGYGKSSGKISEKGLYLDAEASYDTLKSLGYGEKDIVPYGRSLGSGVAIDLAANRPAGALILEAPFTTLPELASCLVPIPIPSSYISYKFDNMKKAPAIKIPTLILHGDADELIPTDHGKRLYNGFGGRKELVIIENGGHNNLSEFSKYHSALKNFLDGL